MKNQLNTVLAEACRQGLADGVCSAVTAGISVGWNTGRIHVKFAGGRTRFDDTGLPVEEGTFFDLASLTKPLCTTLLTLSLVGQDRLHLHSSLADILGGPVVEEKKYIEIREILNHSSGLPPYQSYFEEFMAQPSAEAKHQLINRIFLEPLAYPTGSECHYSDLGFILLGHLVEYITGLPLQTSFRQQITERLGLAEDLFFLPLDRPLAVDRTRIAATESCRWRGRTLQGEVHDEHGWLMGGVAGHAGLFGTLHGVLALGEWILDLWQGRTEHSTIPVALLRTALERQLANGTWCLGFDTPTVGSSSSGRYFSPCSVGHLGFSGTSFWIDPKRDVVVVLLTNRVHPSRENTRIRRFRPFFHDQVMACLLAGLEA